MSRRSHVIVDDEEDVAVAASDREGTFVNEDEDDDDKARLLAALGPDAPPEHAVGAYEAQRTSRSDRGWTRTRAIWWMTS